MFRIILISSLGLSLILSLVSFASQLAPLDFEIIPIHNDLLKDRAYVFEEYEGLSNFTVVENAVSGDKTLTLSERTNFNALELVVYLTASGNYYVTQVATISANTITLVEPLKEDINKGDHLWNFYDDASHPNEVGYKALADFALLHLDIELLENKTHVFIGDSWLASKTVEARIVSKIKVSDSLNKAVGGRRSIDVLNAFEEDLSDLQFSPDYVWITLGTNDYWLDVSAEKYIQNVEEIIRKSNSLGAKVIIFDSSVGPLEWDEQSDSFKSIRKDLSDAYSIKLAELYSRNQTDSSDNRSRGGSVILLDLAVLWGIFIRRRKLVRDKNYSSSIA